MNSKQKQADEEFEKIEAMGGDGKTAVEDTKSILLEEQRIQKAKEANMLETLTKKLVQKKLYIRTLSEILKLKLFEDQMPRGVSYRIAPNEIGIYMELYVQGRMFAQAFKVSGDPLLDLNAIDIFIMRVENTVEKVWIEKMP